MSCCRATTQYSVVPHSGKWELPQYLTVLSRTKFATIITAALDTAAPNLVDTINADYATGNYTNTQAKLTVIHNALIAAPFPAISNSPAISVSVWLPNGTNNLTTVGANNAPSGIARLQVDYSEGVENGSSPQGNNTARNLAIQLKLAQYQLVVLASLEEDPLYRPCDPEGDDVCPPDDSDDSDCEEDCANSFLPQLCTVQWKLA